MTRLTKELAILIALMIALGAVSEAGAKRKKKRKKRKQAAVEQVVTPPAEVPAETPSMPPEASEATAPAPGKTPQPAPSDEPPAAPDPTLTGAPGRAPPDAVSPPETGTGGVDAAVAAPRPGSSPEPATNGVEVIDAAPGAEGAVVSEGAAAAVAVPADLFVVTGAIKVGTIIPGVFSALDAAFFGSVEVGYFLPFLSQRLVVVADFSYSRPERISRYDSSDPRLPGDGSFRYRITEDQYSIGLGLLARVFPPRSTDLFGLNFYGALKGRLELQHAAEGAKSMTGFGRNEETATRGAIFFAGGAELALGPGAVLAELSFAWAPLEHEVTGKVGTGGFGFLAGYVFLLGGNQ